MSSCVGWHLTLQVHTKLKIRKDFRESRREPVCRQAGKQLLIAIVVRWHFNIIVFIYKFSELSINFLSFSATSS